MNKLNALVISVIVLGASIGVLIGHALDDMVFEYACKTSGVIPFRTNVNMFILPVIISVILGLYCWLVIYVTDKKKGGDL